MLHDSHETISWGIMKNVEIRALKEETMFLESKRSIRP